MNEDLQKQYVLIIDIEDLYTTAVDANYMYWVNFTGGTIERCPIGGGAITVLATGLNEPCGICVDSNYIYFTEFTPGKTCRTSLTGGAVTELVTGLTQPSGCAAEGKYNTRIYRNSFKECVAYLKEVIFFYQNPKLYIKSAYVITPDNKKIKLDVSTGEIKEEKTWTLLYKTARGRSRVTNSAFSGIKSLEDCKQRAKQASVYCRDHYIDMHDVVAISTDGDRVVINVEGGKTEIVLDEKEDDVDKLKDKIKELEQELEKNKQALNRIKNLLVF